MTEEELERASYRLLVVATHWFGRFQDAYKAGDKPAMLVADLAHSMTNAAHKNLLDTTGCNR